MWLVGGTYGCGKNVYIGVVSGCCCKEVYRYPHNNLYFPYSTCISFFFGSSIPTSLFIF